MNNGGITVSIASGLNDTIFGKVQVPMKSYLLKRAEAFEQESVLDKLFRMEKSEHWAEGYSGETAMDDFVPVGEGGAYPQSDFSAGYLQSLVNETWKNSFAVTKELVEDAQLGAMRQRANKLITSYYRTREKFGRYLYAGGLQGTTVAFGAKSFKCSSADGQALFSKTHPAKVKGAQQTNLYAGSFTAANLGEVETRMQNLRGDNGEVLGISPDTIWIPNDATLKKTVFEVIGADKDPATSNNAFNYQFGRWNVICDPYLTMALSDLGISDKPWMLLDSKFLGVADGAIFQDRVKLAIRSVVDDNNDDNKWLGRARWTGGFVDWRFVAAGGMTGGTSLG